MNMMRPSAVVVLTAALAGVALVSAARAELSASAKPKRPDPCTLLTDADADLITGVPMVRDKLDPMYALVQCVYSQKDKKPFQHAGVTLSLGGYGMSKESNDSAWKMLKSGATARGQTMDTKDLAGIGDEAFITHKKDPMTFQTILYARRGERYFILDARDLPAERLQALRDVGKKIVPKL